MIRFCWILILFIFSTSLFAQKAKIKWSAAFEKALKNHGIPEVLKQEGDLLYFLVDQGKKKKRHILSYNIKTEAIEVDEIEWMQYAAMSENSKIIQTKNETFRFFLEFDWGDKKVILKSQKFKQGDFEAPKAIYEHVFDKGESFKRFNFGETLSKDFNAMITLNQDSTKLVFAKEVFIRDEAKEHEMLFAVFDEELNLLWDKIVSMPFAWYKSFAERAKLSKSGEHIFLTNRYYKKGVTPPFYKVFQITRNKLVEHNIELKEKLTVLDLTPYFNEDSQELIIAGIYRKFNRYYLEGVFSGMKRIEDEAEISFNYYPFTEEEKDVSETYEIVVSNILPGNRLQFLAENKNVKSSPNGGGGSDLHYNYLGLVLTTISAQGELINKWKGYRKSVGFSNPRKSYAYFYKGGYTWLLYDSWLTKKDKKKYKLQMMNFNSIAKLYCFDNDGKRVSEKMLFTIKDPKYFYAQIAPYLHGNQIYFLARNKPKPVGSALTKPKIYMGALSLKELQ